MIATITFPLDGSPATAVLKSDYTWEVEPGDDLLRESLDLRTLGADRSPSRGNWAQWHAGQMAEVLGGTVEFPEVKPVPEGSAQ